MQDDDDGDFDVYLTDCSQNGTFVNGELVGKWKVSTHRQHLFPKYYKGVLVWLIPKKLKSFKAVVSLLV